MAAPMNFGRPHTSNLTSALQSTSNESQAMNIINGNGPHSSLSHRDSLTGAMAASGSYHGTGAQPISVNRQKPRRESFAGSLVSGMSFGGVSVGSFVRDEYDPSHLYATTSDNHSIIMTGSSPFPQQSPSYHSSSYIPKMEANFMKDFECCGLVMASLHDLLHHYEQYHTDSIHQRNNTQPSAVSDSRAAIASNTANAVRQSAQQPPPRPVTPKIQKVEPARPYTISKHPSLDMDAVQDMEMDDVESNAWDFSNQSRMMPQSQFRPPIDTKQHQGLRKSTPTTPVINFNPTVSSVNTPTLIAHPTHAQKWPTPDSSTPGTPDADPGYAFIDRPRNHFENFQFGNGNEMLDLCIDEPAKRLFTANGGFSGQLSNAQRLGDAQYSENSDLAKTIREQQRLAGIPDGGSGLNDGVPKPFHCPVIGCEKAYKNQNGLKYHKAVRLFS